MMAGFSQEEMAMYMAAYSVALHFRNLLSIILLMLEYYRHNFLNRKRKRCRNGDHCESPTEMVTALVKESSPPEGAEAAAAVDHPKQTVQDDFFGVDEDLEMVNDDAFVTPDSSKSKRKKVDVPVQEELNVPSKKVKKNGSASDRHPENFQKQMETVFQLCAATNKEIEKMATFFDRINVADDNEQRVLQMIMNLQGLSEEKAIQAFGVISADKGKTDSFLLMPDEESKLIYVSCVLGGKLR